MRIRLTDAAASRVKEQLGANGRLKLTYDAEGCGCAVSGVPALWIVDAPGPTDAETAAEPLPVLYEPRHEVFFDEEMKLDYHAQRDVFSLKSDTQIYHTQLLLKDRRKSQAASKA